jgi:hypothetical protein
MLPETVTLLKSFKGKVCTIFTTPINHPFTADQMREYFVGKVESVNQDGILIRHHVTGGRTFISMSKLTGVAEEQTLDPADPRDREIIERLRKKEAPAVVEPPPIPLPPGLTVPQGEFVNADFLGKLSNFGKQAASDPRPK